MKEPSTGLLAGLLRPDLTIGVRDPSQGGLKDRACLSLVFAYHQYWAVGVPDNAVGDAPHKRSSYPASPPATDNYQPSAQLLGAVGNLPTGCP
jgi:hypothetical protein